MGTHGGGTTQNSNQWKVTGGLALGALGVVFGDIGTSPLYTMKECLAVLPGMEHKAAVLGILSLIFWSLVVVVGVKYQSYVMYANNRGEGGVFAMLALLQGKQRGMPGLRMGGTAILILIGAALLCGDGFITPAISVLSAAEGLKYIHPELEHFSVPVACVVLALLFAVQHKGTGHIGSIFGPVIMIWFTTLGLLGFLQIWKNPDVLYAMSPYYGVNLLITHPGAIAPLLGGVVLAITGGEALYADMGHFGHKAISVAWYGVTLPGLCLSYFGQGAWALHHPASTENPFFALAPEGPMKWFLVVIGMAATVIASQALISGTYSLTRQGILLGYFPRLPITHTSSNQEGQIYIGVVNWVLATGCILLVLGFRTSGALASAYGTAVTGAMWVTTVAFYLVTRRVWGWTRTHALLVCGVFFLVDMAFFSANLTKFFHGGWFPLIVGGGIFAIMYAWKVGRAHIANQLYSHGIDPEYLVTDIKANNVPRLGGNAVFMTSNPQTVPVALLHHLKVNQCLHKNVILMCIITEDVPYLKKQDRAVVANMGENIYRLDVHYGFMEVPNVPAVLRMAQEELGLEIGKKPVTYYFNRELVLTDGPAKMPRILKSLYRLLSNNASPAKDYFGIPAQQIVEMGLPVKL